MPIPDVPLSCCCDWGTGRIGRGLTEWFLSAGGGGTFSLYKRRRSDLSSISISTFAAAQFISQIDKDENFYYYNGATPLLRKYLFNGTIVWSHTPATVLASSFHHFTVDNELNVYVVGEVDLAGNSVTESLRLQKLNSSGSVVWTFDKTPPELGPGGTFTRLVPRGVCVDLSGNVHVTGSRIVTNADFTDRFTGHFEVHVDVDGNEIWDDLSTDTTQGTHNSSGRQCVSDEAGNTICRYLSFRSDGSGGDTDDNVTLKAYDPDGNVLFTHTKTELPSTNLIQYFDGCLYACGPTQNVNEVNNTFFRKYSGSDYTTEDWSDDPVVAKIVPRFALDHIGNVYGTYLSTSPTRTTIRKLSSALGALITSGEISGVGPIFPMVPPGNPIQFFQ